MNFVKDGSKHLVLDGSMDKRRNVRSVRFVLGEEMDNHKVIEIELSFEFLILLNMLSLINIIIELHSLFPKMQFITKTNFSMYFQPTCS